MTCYTHFMKQVAKKTAKTALTEVTPKRASTKTKAFDVDAYLEMNVGKYTKAEAESMMRHVERLRGRKFNR
jgi:hypothetical protein